MALKDKIASWKDYFTSNEAEDEYEYDEYDDEFEDEVPVGKAQTASQNSNFHSTQRTGGYNTVAQRPSATAMKVIVIEPKKFEDSENITNQLRDMRPVVINFENTDSHEAARIVDFVSGATFALDGKLEKIGKDIFICVPNNISVDYSDKVYGEISDKLSWKEPQM